uniref:PEHE domain-containing protein n=1 Tax=Rhabditophanes sp. KR3021 TaxID=114890 RepID=A0AC35U842_9BILA
MFTNIYGKDDEESLGSKPPKSPLFPFSKPRNSSIGPKSRYVMKDRSLESINLMEMSVRNSLCIGVKPMANSCPVQSPSFKHKTCTDNMKPNLEESTANAKDDLTEKEKQIRDEFIILQIQLEYDQERMNAQRKNPSFANWLKHQDGAEVYQSYGSTTPNQSTHSHVTKKQCKGPYRIDVVEPIYNNEFNIQTPPLSKKSYLKKEVLSNILLYNFIPLLS